MMSREEAKNQQKILEEQKEQKQAEARVKL